MKILKRNIAIIIYVIYQEIIFMILTKGDIQNIFFKCLFLLQISIGLSMIFVFNKKINKVLAGVLMIIISAIHIIQCLYYKTFEEAISLYSIINGGKVVQFTSLIINVLLSNWYVLLFFLSPVFIYFLLFKKIEIEKNNKKDMVFLTIILILVYLLTVLIMNFDKKEDIYSIKNLYYNINRSTQNLEKFGVLTALRLDAQRMILPFEEKQLYKYEDSEGNVKILNNEDYNMLQIDFDLLIEEEVDDEVKEIHQYIKVQEPTRKNEYTGKFLGKNLIVIVAESFSWLAIREDVTPTLYKLANQGIQFKNFYTPLFPVSTADGEYMTDTALLPAEGVWSIQEVEGKTFPYSYANVLKKQGYNSYAYHNYKYDYYQRQIYFETMGYDSYLAQGNGLEERMDFSKNPSSDYEMIKSTINDYVDDEKFLAYYMTMSGHMSYDKTNAMVNKNWNSVKDLPYSEKAKAYLATQIELDKAVAEIINVLIEKGKLEETVIVISGDHYPYGLNEKEIKELSLFNMSDYHFERFHMPLIIYNSEIDKNIEITKYASSIDVLPTVLNLFGVEYDSRLLIGKDILSDIDSLIIFSDRSFITNKGKYNSDTRTFNSFDEISLDNNYVKNIQKNIYLKYRYSRMILEKNYYKNIIMLE